MSKKRRFPLPLAILLPLFAAIVIGEIGLYFGSYFVLNDTITQNAKAEDAEDLGLIDEYFSTNEYAGLGYAVVPQIKAYEDRKPAGPFVPGSQEEADYKDYIGNNVQGMLYSNAKNYLQRYMTTFIGMFYEDVAANRMVVVMRCSINDEESGPSPQPKKDNSLYLGAFFPRDAIFESSAGFYGESVVDANMGRMFASALYLSEVHYPNDKDGSQYGGPYRVWVVRETLWNDVYATIPLFTRNYAVLAAIVLVALLALAYLLIYMIVLRPTKKLSRNANTYVEKLKSGEICSVFTPNQRRFKDEMTDLNDGFYYTQEAITEYSEKVRKSAAYEEKINADLRLAERIQGSMVPHDPLVENDYMVRGFMQPAKEVGGDLFDYFKIDEDHVGFFIGDVSGKGVPASLFMAKTQTLLRLLAGKLDIAGANRLLCQGNDELLFVTAFIGVLNRKTGLLRYVNCGHEPAFLFHDGTYAALEANPNSPLGWIEDMEFPIEEKRLSHGDRLFLYTDGISEAMDIDGNLFGKERILETLNNAPELSNEVLLDQMLFAINDFVRGAEQSDDMCMLSLDYAREAMLRIKPSLDGLEDLPAFVDEFLEKDDVSFVSPIQVILDELVSNVVKYADTGGKDIYLCLRDDGDYIYGTIIDTGHPFDPTADKPVHDEDKPGGLGITMAVNMSDGFHYRRVGEYNVLRFAKKRAKKKAKPEQA